MADSALESSTGRRVIRAPRGATLSCKGWQQEAALRMLMNSLDPEVAERPADLMVCGGGKAARNWACYDAIIASLRALENDETLLVQSGKPVAIFRALPSAPRLLIANGNLAGHGKGSEQFKELERTGPALYGESAAASWTYIGLQGALPGTYETFSAAARKHFGGDLAGRLVVSGGMGSQGGAQPLAATLNGAAFLGIDVDPDHIKRCVKSGYCDVMVNDLDESLRILKNAVRKREPASVGLVGNCADLIPALAKRGVVPDLLTDQTSAHDLLNGYVPIGLDVAAASKLREHDPGEYRRRALDSIAAHVRGMLDLRKLGSLPFDSGNNIFAMALERGVKDANDIPGFVPAYLRPLLCEGRGALLCVALSGEPADIYRIDELALTMFTDDEMLMRWIRIAKKHVRFQGLPARVCWLGSSETAHFGLALNDLVARGELNAPVVIVRDYFGGGSAGSLFVKIEAMRDGSDAVADWPFLNAMLSIASGASWVSINIGGGSGIADYVHAGFAVVVDGTPEMSARIESALTYDPAMGIARHSDAGYLEALDVARKSGIKIPMK